MAACFRGWAFSKRRGSATATVTAAYYAGGSYRTLAPTTFDALTIAITTEMFAGGLPTPR